MLKQALRSCRRLGLISADQCERATDLPRVTGQSARPGRALTSEDMERLEKRFSEIEPPYRQMARALFAVGIGAGLRREELARLLLEGVQGDTLRFVGKGLREAAQPIAPWAQAVLEEWLAARKLADFRSPTVFLLYDEAGQTLVDVPMKPRDVWDLVRRERRAAGIAKITTHDLRRTFVTRAIREDPIHAKTLARHANMATTERYDRRGEEEARELLGRLPPMMGAPRVSEAVALEAAASVARQLGRQPWYAGARIAPDAAEGHVVELLVRRLVNLKTSRVRGVRVVTRVTP